MAPADVGAANEWARKDELMALPAETQLIVAMDQVLAELRMIRAEGKEYTVNEPDILVAVLAELKGLRADLAERSASVSSVEIDSNGKAGDTKIKVKTYAESLTPVGEAIEDFAFGMREIQRLQAANWAETVDALNGKPA